MLLYQVAEKFLASPAHDVNRCVVSDRCLGGDAGRDESSGSLFSYVDLEAGVTRCDPDAGSRIWAHGTHRRARNRDRHLPSRHLAQPRPGAAHPFGDRQHGTGRRRQVADWSSVSGPSSRFRPWRRPCSRSIAAPAAARSPGLPARRKSASILASFSLSSSSSTIANRRSEMPRRP